MEKKKFLVVGMTCSACQAHVFKAVEKLDGVKLVNVNLLNGLMDVEFDSNVCSVKDIQNAVANAGYKAEEHTENTTKKLEKNYKLL